MKLLKGYFKGREDYYKSKKKLLFILFVKKIIA